MLTTQIAIIGSGVAGIQAALYSSRRKVETIVLGKTAASSLNSADIENYFGFAGLQSGAALLAASKQQAEKFGTKFVAEDVIDVEKAGEDFVLKLESGQEIAAKAIVIATGVSRKKLNVTGEKEYLGRGVSYCVDCDGMFFRGKDVVLTGDGSAACDGVLTLAKIAKQVYFVSENLDFKTDLANVQVFAKNKVAAIKGDGNFVNSVVLNDGQELVTNGVFIEFGAKGAVDLFAKFGLKMDEVTFKHIEVDQRQMTNIAGVFAAGDITGAPYQVAIAAGEGAKAGMSAADYVKSGG